MPEGDNRGCKVFRDDEGDEITLSAAEIDDATKIVNIALGMEEIEVLPDHIAGSPFVVRFFEEGFMRLEREDGVGSVRFAFEEGNDLIETLYMARDMAQNDQALSGPAGHVRPDWTN